MPSIWRWGFMRRQRFCGLASRNVIEIAVVLIFFYSVYIYQNALPPTSANNDKSHPVSTYSTDKVKDTSKRDSVKGPQHPQMNNDFLMGSDAKTGVPLVKPVANHKGMDKDIGAERMGDYEFVYHRYEGEKAEKIQGTVLYNLHQSVHNAV